MILGAVLAGGQSTRFGSDKALALLDGRTLLEHAAHTLARWCERVVVIGRDDGPVETLPDWPRPGMGPLGGVAAALRLAKAQGFETVLTIGVDSLDLPGNLADLLKPAPAYVADQPVIALWPAIAVAAVTDILEGDGRHSMIALAERIGARAIRLPCGTANINTPVDLDSIAKRS